MPEEVKMIPGDPESVEDQTPAIGWMELAGLSVCLTRSTQDGKLLVALESESGEPLDVRVEAMKQGDEYGTLWEGALR